MPWLWEVWSDQPPSLWATASPVMLQRREKERKEHEMEVRKYRQIIKEEMPELLSDWQAAEPSYDDILPPPQRAWISAKQLPMGRTNWYRLYRDITVNWKDLNGLQNRRRIWKDVEEIKRRIKQFREDDEL
jgi:hypothetical protein